MKATTVALPKTYHHPVSGGTGCFARPSKNAISPVRSSNASMNSLSSFIISRSSERHGAGEDFDFAIPNPHRIFEQRVGRRTGRDLPVGVIDTAVAGAHKEAGILKPMNGASEVGAVHR